MSGDDRRTGSVPGSVPESVAESRCREVTGILVARIRGGELAPGDRFPRLWELSRTYGIDRGIAALVQHELKRQGLIRIVGGRPVVAEGRHAGLTPVALDRAGPIPLYRQIADILAALIKNGELAPGEKIPSEDELSGVFGVARGTARSAHRELRERGLAHTVGGAGTIVRVGEAETGSDVRPMYLRIAREIADQIQDGRIAPDRPIPTRQALVARYGVSVETARRAVGMLCWAGWVYTVAGRPRFVARPERWPAREAWEKATAGRGAGPRVFAAGGLLG
ncbi:GntR family transcriptional regulator [Acrocarpospora sp. B8E8]|uniref:GntR family transcriptional regulator n=1 Tax=Acrocarpospora sp. B8E8 TaxID=3153572 RepID=UPI00325F5E5F